MADGALHQYGQIFMGSRGGVSQGQLKIGPGGLVWRRSTGGKTVEIKKEDVSGLAWTKTSRGCQLGVQCAEGPTVNFLGFREKDQDVLGPYFQSTFGVALAPGEQAVSGHNWGSVQLSGSSLRFLVEGRVAFEVPLPDVSQAQQSKEEVMLEFHVDDTAADDKEDTLVEVALHVPAACEDWAPPAPEPQADGAPAPPNTASAAMALLSAVQAHTDADGATSDDAVCIFDDVAVLAPRGRFEVELHSGFLKMTGQTQDFKIRYASILRLFVLPKNSTPHTLVVISLDPPIRKGQTYYSHLLCQFASDEDTQVDLDISEEALAAKNEKCGGRLQRTMGGAIADVFARALRGLSGAKLTRTGGFTNATDGGPAIRCSYKSDEGYLYPLERALFYVHKPPLLLSHDDIEAVEFQRQGGGVISATAKTFDLVIRTKGEQEFQFRNIQKSEWQALFNFIHAKRIRIDNFAFAKHGPQGPNAPTAALDLGDELDAGMRAAAAEAEDSDEEDEDFRGGSDDDDASSGGTDDDASGSDDAEMIDEEGISAGAVGGGSDKRGGSGGGGAKRKGSAGGGGAAAAPAPPKKPKKAAAPKEEGASGGGAAPARKPRKKKDPAAPKKALSAFMFFSSETRESVKADHPGITFGEVGKALGERWKALPAQDKARFEEMAARDKERYAAAMAQYQATGGGAAAGAGPSSGGGGKSGGGDDDGPGDDWDELGD